DEAYHYVHERVGQTVQQLYGMEQTPVRLIGGGVSGVPVILSLRPEQPETLCRRLAEHLDLEVRRQKLKKIGVLEFLQPLGKIEGLAAAELPLYCAERVRAALEKLAGSDYQVVDAATMGQAAKDVAVELMDRPKTWQQLSQRVNGMDGAIYGTLR